MKQIAIAGIGLLVLGVYLGSVSEVSYDAYGDLAMRPVYPWASILSSFGVIFIVVGILASILDWKHRTRTAIKKSG